MGKEAKYQSRLIGILRDMFPGCVILKNDSGYIQGIPDLTILWGCNWAMLEVKESAESDFRPNQEYYITELNNMSFAAVIYPDNERAVLHDLQHALSAQR